MKSKVLFILILLSCGLNSFAQEKTFFVPDPATARWSYMETDANGKPVSQTFFSVDSMSGDAVNGSVKLGIEAVTVEKPADTLKSSLFYRFKDGECMVDMNAFFEADVLADMVGQAIEKGSTNASEAEIKAAIEEMKKMIKVTGEVRGIPRYPKVGDLPDYEFQFKLSIISIAVTGEERKITGSEKLQTPAGTFDCFVIEETITSKAMMQKDVEKNISWYAYGIGLVKEETYDKKGRLVSTTLLNSINWQLK